jgi:hypothetical protein
VESVFDAPVIADGTRKRFGSEFSRGNVIPGLQNGLLPLDHTQRIDSPEYRTIEPRCRIHLPGVGQGAVGLNDVASMAELDDIVSIVRFTDEGVFQRLLQLRLIAISRCVPMASILTRQPLISIAFSNLGMAVISLLLSATFS